MRISTELRLQAYEFSAAYVERELIAQRQGPPLKKYILDDSLDVRPPANAWTLADELYCIGDVPAVLKASGELTSKRLRENKKDDSKHCVHRVLNSFSKASIFIQASSEHHFLTMKERKNAPSHIELLDYLPSPITIIWTTMTTWKQSTHGKHDFCMNNIEKRPLGPLLTLSVRLGAYHNSSSVHRRLTLAMAWARTLTSHDLPAI